MLRDQRMEALAELETRRVPGLRAMQVAPNRAVSCIALPLPPPCGAMCTDQSLTIAPPLAVPNQVRSVPTFLAAVFTGRDEAPARIRTRCACELPGFAVLLLPCAAD